MSAQPETVAKRPSRVSFADARLIARRWASGHGASSSIALPASLGHVLAANVRAECDHPLFDMAAMDGFAIDSTATRFASPSNPVELPIAATALAGAPSPEAAGRAVEIMTGAPMPTDCDTVLPVEKCNVRLGRTARILVLEEPADLGKNVRKLGEDARRGDMVAKAGGRVTAASIGALASYGVGSVLCRQKPRVTILATGDELSGLPLIGDASIYNSNGPMISNLVVESGGHLTGSHVVRDDPSLISALITQLRDTAETDIIISTGGVSAGTKDFIPAALKELGAVVHFHGISMQPGKPALFATLPTGELFFGLPGNPFAAYVAFRFFVHAAMQVLLGTPQEAGIPCLVDVPGKAGLAIVQKARLTIDQEGKLQATTIGGQQSHIMRPLTEADALLVIDRTTGERSCRAFPLSPNQGFQLDQGFLQPSAADELCPLEVSPRPCVRRDPRG